MSEWVVKVLETIILGGVVAGVTRYYVQDALDRRNGHYKRTEEHQDRLEALARTRTLIDARQLTRLESIDESIQDIHKDIQKG